MHAAFKGPASQCTGSIIESAIIVHSTLGPGLLESAYEACMLRLLKARGHAVSSQVPVPITFLGGVVDVGYRMDLLVDHSVIVELKTVNRFAPIHEAQLLSYLRLSGLRVGLLLNFHVVRMKDGIRRMIN